MLEGILEAILGSVFEVLFEVVAPVFCWLILFPVIWLVSLPFILVIALFRWPRYGAAVAGMVFAVHTYWHEHGLSCLFG